jgi:hypothetical protein
MPSNGAGAFHRRLHEQIGAKIGLPLSKKIPFHPQLFMSIPVMKGKKIEGIVPPRVTTFGDDEVSGTVKLYQNSDKGYVADVEMSKPVKMKFSVPLERTDSKIATSFKFDNPERKVYVVFQPGEWNVKVNLNADEYQFAGIVLNDVSPPAIKADYVSNYEHSEV